MDNGAAFKRIEQAEIKLAEVRVKCAAIEKRIAQAKAKLLDLTQTS